VRGGARAPHEGIIGAYMTSGSLVSAIVPTRGREIALERAVTSILEQDHVGPIEIVVVFDQEDPRAIDLDLPANRSIVTMRNERTPGAGGARNTGLAAARGVVLAFCDDDDVWHRPKLRLQLHALARSPEVSAVTCGTVVVSKRRRRVRRPPGVAVTHRQLLSSRVASLHTSTLVVPEHIVNDVGGFDESIPGSYSEDYEWLLRATTRGPVGVIPDPLVTVALGGSWFTSDTALIADALDYLLRIHPELIDEPHNGARITSRLALFRAASGDREEALRYAKRAYRLDPTQPRTYLAFLMARGLLPAGFMRWVPDSIAARM
jgi:glycosyltransferase involved in cell wall biosynthesis